MFAFKQFTVRQDGAAMKVGTDGVLLGAWMHIPENCKRVLDIGTGTGLIALMAAQRAPGVHIVGVEIDSQSACQAHENIANSKWSDRIEIVNSSIQEYHSTEKFELIVSNPPFFDGTLVCPDSERTAARHTVSLNFSELTAAAERLLSNDGIFSVILPYESAGSFVGAGNMHLLRRCDVRTKRSKQPKRTMLEFTLKFTGAPTFEELIISDDNGYTEQYIALTSDFYLKM